MVNHDWNWPGFQAHASVSEALYLRLVLLLKAHFKFANMETLRNANWSKVGDGKANLVKFTSRKWLTENRTAPRKLDFQAKPLSRSRGNKAAFLSLYKVTMESKDQKVKINLFYCLSGERMKSKQNAVEMNNALNSGVADKCSSHMSLSRMQL